MARTGNRIAFLVPAAVACGILLGGIAGCRDQADQTDQAESAVEATVDMGSLSEAEAELVRTAALIANAIDTAPATAAGLLAENDMTARDFEELIYRISADEKLSAAYDAARK